MVDPTHKPVTVSDKVAFIEAKFYERVTGDSRQCIWPTAHFSPPKIQFASDTYTMWSAINIADHLMVSLNLTSNMLVTVAWAGNKPYIFTEVVKSFEPPYHLKPDRRAAAKKC